MRKINNTIIPPGYRLTIGSWENDADNYKTTVLEGLTKERVEYLLELCRNFTSGSNNGGATFGNMYEPSDTRLAQATDRILEVMARHPAALTEDEVDLLNGTGDYEDLSKDDIGYTCQEIIGDLLSYSENYTFRVYDGATVQFVPHQIEMQDVTHEFKVMS